MIPSPQTTLGTENSARDPRDVARSAINSEHLPPFLSARPTPSSSTSSTKRARSNSIEDRQTAQDQNEPTASVTASAWKGWAELENDPLVFTQLVRDWGVPDVRVDEVIPLDAILEKKPESVMGLIFLSRWTPSEVTGDDASIEYPESLWFANQVSTFSCATLALMNILNNRANLDLGAELNVFKSTTTPMTSMERGLALDNFQFVKGVHNSFTRELDRMIVDLQLRADFQADSRTRAPQKKRRKFYRKKERHDDDNGFHFIAYVPVEGHVWKLDGTDAQPRRLASFNDTDSWLLSSVADIQAQMEDPEASAMEFSCLSVTGERSTSTDDGDSTRVERMREDWSPFIVHMLKLHAEKGDIESLL